MIYVVIVLPDRTRVPVRPGETVLDASAAMGSATRWAAAKAAVAGVRSKLVSGDVIYEKTVAQSVLSDQDRVNGVCLPCRAVPATDICDQAESHRPAGAGPVQRPARPNET